MKPRKKKVKPIPNGTIGHAEVKIGDSRVMLTDEYREMDFLSPLTRGGTTVHIHLCVADADKMAERAVQALWHLATHTEDVSLAELKKRAAKLAG